jgi:hypothetical protein
VIGTAFAHEKGDGFNEILQALPIPEVTAGHPLDAALPVDPRCDTCIDAKAFTDIVARLEKNFFRMGPQRRSDGDESHLTTQL